MKNGRYLLTLLALCGSIHSSPTMAAASDGPADQAAVQRDLEEILNLWRDGRCTQLFDRLSPGGRTSRESFCAKLEQAERKPSCCWEKMQEVRVTISSPNQARLRAKLGLEMRSGDMVYHTGTLRLSRDEGYWRLSVNDLLALAGGPSRQKRTSPGAPSRQNRR